MGMTIRVGQGQSHLPVDVLGISTVFSQKGRLHLKGRLRQQPAGDFTEESRNSSNGHFAKSGLAPTRSTHAGDKRDASHARPRPISEQDPPPRKDPRESRGDMPRRCWSEGKRHFIKLPTAGEEPEDGGAMPRPQPRRSRQPGSRPPNLKPDHRLYKGVWTLRLGRSDPSSSSSRPNSSRSLVATVC
jgi:hypothetical protein